MILATKNTKLKISSHGFTLIELMIVVAIIGVLSSVAIPAFSRYMQKAKTVEAVANLDKMKVGARAYYEADHWLATALVDKNFPNSVTRQPAIVPKGQKDATLVDMPDLNFSISEPHYYSYTFNNTGSTGPDATYTALAEGDLNGNSAPSRFELRGSIDSTTGAVFAAGPIIANELE